MNLKNIKWTLVLAWAAANVTLVSCEDEPDAYEGTSGVPTISYIRPLDAAVKDSLLTSASMQENIVIVGNNLRSIKQIDFNDRTAILNTSYMTDNTIIVQVPGSLPTVVSDKMYLITNGNDTVTYDFSVTIPAPKVSSMENEWAKTGEDAVIIGDYFLDYDNFPLTITMGDGSLLDSRYVKSIEKTKIVFEVPENAPDGAITVTSKYGSTKSVFHFHDKRGMLFDFDTPNALSGYVLGNHGWHAMPIESDATSLSGNFLRLGSPETSFDGSWNDGAFSFEYWAGTWDQDGSGNYLFQNDGIKLNDLVDFSDWNNMALKFEMYIPKENPWTCAPMQVIFAGPDKVTIYAANNTFFHDDNDKFGRALYAPWVATGSYDTGNKWVTVTLPIGGENGVFNKYYDGTAADKSFKSAEDFASLTIFVVNGGGYDGTPGNPVIKIDNIRAVPNK